MVEKSSVEMLLSMINKLLFTIGNVIVRRLHGMSLCLFAFLKKLLCDHKSCLEVLLVVTMYYASNAGSSRGSDTSCCMYNCRGFSRPNDKYVTQTRQYFVLISFLLHCCVLYLDASVI